MALTATQWRLLEALSRRAGRLVSAPQLLVADYGPDHTEHDHCSRIDVRQWRQRIEPEPAQPRYVVNEAGVGYRLLPDGLEGGTAAVPKLVP